MSSASEDETRRRTREWWSTSIIDIEPGRIRTRGYPIEELIGRVSFPQMIWLMLRGELPDRSRADLLEAALVAAVDHGPQAPSIAIARMAVTCGLPLNGAMASAINVLDDVHGGAGEQCLAIYERADALMATLPLAQAVDAAIDEYVEAYGKVIPGFGHRFHPVDPRVAPLFEKVEAARLAGAVTGGFARIGTEVAAAVRRRTGKALPMNIDGITAVVFGELGFPAPLARGLFVLSRSVGILSHAWEQSQQGHRIKGPTPPEIGYAYTGEALRHPPAA